MLFQISCVDQKLLVDLNPSAIPVRGIWESA